MVAKVDKFSAFLQFLGYQHQPCLLWLKVFPWLSWIYSFHRRILPAIPRQSCEVWARIPYRIIKVFIYLLGTMHRAQCLHQLPVCIKVHLISWSLLQTICKGEMCIVYLCVKPLYSLKIIHSATYSKCGGGAMGKHAFPSNILCLRCTYGRIIPTWPQQKQPTAPSLAWQTSQPGMHIPCMGYKDAQERSPIQRTAVIAWLCLRSFCATGLK